VEEGEQRGKSCKYLDHLKQFCIFFVIEMCSIFALLQPNNAPMDKTGQPLCFQGFSEVQKKVNKGANLVCI
jgi:hypothetical protein